MLSKCLHQLYWLFIESIFHMMPKIVPKAMPSLHLRHVLLSSFSFSHWRPYTRFCVLFTEPVLLHIMSSKEKALDSVSEQDITVTVILQYRESKAALYPPDWDGGNLANETIQGIELDALAMGIRAQFSRKNISSPKVGAIEFFWRTSPVRVRLILCSRANHDLNSRSAGNISRYHKLERFSRKNVCRSTWVSTIHSPVCVPHNLSNVPAQFESAGSHVSSQEINHCEVQSR